jgi:hypothetical protein
VRLWLARRSRSRDVHLEESVDCSAKLRTTREASVTLWCRGDATGFVSSCGQLLWWRRHLRAGKRLPGVQAKFRDGAWEGHER